MRYPIRQHKSTPAEPTLVQHSQEQPIVAASDPSSRAPGMPTIRLSTLSTTLRQLQQGRGNRYVQGLMEPISTTANSASAPVIQTKSLTLGPANDKYEREADRVAQQVMGPGATQVATPQPPIATPTVMRRPAMQGAEGGAVDTGVQQGIQRARGGGHSLPDAVRTHMEQSLGADFSGVRIHTGARADQLNQSLQARAFTTGQDIFFRRGAYNPNGQGGRQILAHELTHVVQQVNASSNTANTGLVQRLIFAHAYPSSDKKPVQSDFYNESTFQRQIPYNWQFQNSVLYYLKIAEAIHKDEGTWFLDSDVLKICEAVHLGKFKSTSVDDIVKEVLANPDQWRADQNVQPWQRKTAASAANVDPALKKLLIKKGIGKEQYYRSMQKLTKYGKPSKDYPWVQKSIRKDKTNLANRNNRKYLATRARTQARQRKPTAIQQSGDEELYRIEHTADLFERDAGQVTGYKPFSTIKGPNIKRSLTWLDLQQYVRVPTDDIYFRKTSAHGLSAHKPAYYNAKLKPRTGGNYDYDQTKDEVINNPHWNEPKVTVAPMIRKVLQNTPNSKHFLKHYIEGHDNLEGDLSDPGNRGRTAVRLERRRNSLKEVHRAFEEEAPKGKKKRTGSISPSPVRTVLDDNTPLNYELLSDKRRKRLTYDPEFLYAHLHKD